MATVIEELVKELEAAQALCQELCTVALNPAVAQHLPYGCEERVQTWLRTSRHPHQLGVSEVLARIKQLLSWAYQSAGTTACQHYLRCLRSIIGGDRMAA